MGLDFHIDIESIRQWKDYHDAPGRIQELFAKRFFSPHYQKQNPDVTIEDRWIDQAGLTAEFGKIVAIAVSWYKTDGAIATVVWKGDEHRADEQGSLQLFQTMLIKNPTCRLIAHNGKSFDFPFLTRRMLIWRMIIPAPLNAYGKKPWDMTRLVDTVEMWASTEYKPFIALDVLCELFGIESPKEGEVTGATVGDFYWNDPVRSLEPIGKYCGRDTVALAKLHKILENLLVPPKGEG